MNDKQSPLKHQQYPYLFTPKNFSEEGKGLNLRLKNRIVMGSMHTGLEDENDGYQKLAAFYEERAKGGVGLIITGGLSPNWRGKLTPFGATLMYPFQVKKHRRVTDAVHKEGGKIALQILHAGRYAYHPFSAAPSRIQSPITPFKPFALTKWGIRKTISDFARCASLAQKSGYDGVEVMGSEGYFLHEFTVHHTNKRTDEYGGSFINRIRLPLEVVRRIRLICGPNFLIIYRISLLDLISNGLQSDEIIQFARALEKAGVNILNSGIGWHEARVPTIATSVPRANFTKMTRMLKESVKIPVIASNRINTPEVAEKVLSEGDADFVSMARPMLADPEFALKAWTGRADEINTCIACNQSCLDHIFLQKRASCLVNPEAGYETERVLQEASLKKNIAVVGAGPAGLAVSIYLSRRGHQVTVFERRNEIGGQFNLAKNIPGKEEFYETIRYFKVQIERRKIKLNLNTEATETLLKEFDEVVFSSGVIPREIECLKKERENGGTRIVSYDEILSGKIKVKDKVAILGAGGIGFDMAHFVLKQNKNPNPSIFLEGESARKNYFKEWKIDFLNNKFFEKNEEKEFESNQKEIYLLQRKTRFGETLGKTTGWIHRLTLRKNNVKFIGGVVQYLEMSDAGFQFLKQSKDKKSEPTLETLSVEQVIVCAGQESETSLFEAFQKKFPEKKSHLIGGALNAGEIDAARAIREALFLALKI